MTEQVAGAEIAANQSEDVAASTKRLAEWTFSLQGVGADLKRLMVEVKNWVRSQMAHWTDETPPPDPERERDRRRFDDLDYVASRAAARAVAQHARVDMNIRSGHHGGGAGRNGDKSWKDKVTIPLLVAAILGGVATYAKVSSMEATMNERDKAAQRRLDDFIQANQQRHEETERRVSRLEGKMFP